MKIRIINSLQINYFRLIILFTLIGCTEPENEFQRFNKIVKLESTFRNKSIIRSRGQNFIMYNIFKNNEKIEYVYDLDTNLLSSIGDSTQISNNIKNDLKNLLSTMDSFDIRDVSSEFKQNGIDLKFYLKSGESLLNVEDSEKISNPNWKTYINDLKRVSPNWYLDNDDK
jgi:hypothetical protein